MRCSSAAAYVPSSSCRTKPGQLKVQECMQVLYSAPELMLGNPAKDGYDGAAVDIWSTAICLYNMLFGIMPFLVRSCGTLGYLQAERKLL